jgi:predicted DNA-binding transcriptional regulator AlpA
MPVVVNPDPLLSSQEAEQYLGLRYRTLENARARADSRFPPYHKFGGKLVKYSKSDLDAWLRTTKVPCGRRAAA